MSHKLILQLLIAAIIIMPVYADFLELDIDCQDICIPNHQAIWSLTITNIGDTKLQLLGFKIIDSVSDQEIVNIEQEKAVEIKSYNRQIFNFQANIPYPNVNKNIVMHVCLINQPELDSWGKVGKKIEHCYDDLNFSIKTTDCLNSSDCFDDLYCQNMSCLNLSCSYCQYKHQHICNNYECCIDEECKKNEKCLDNVCTALKCKNEEYIVNHTCSSTLCEADQGIINFTCSPLNCNYNEFIQNHECVKLNCSDDDFYFNNSCVKLNCSYNKAPVNHSCIFLNCSDKEAYINHECKKLTCLFFQKAEQHECRINSNIILFLFLLFMAYFLIILNLKKYRYIKNKRFVSSYFEKNIKTEKKKEEKTDKKPEDKK